MADHRILLGTSILTADFMHLGDQIAAAERGGVDFIHFDVMDGQFVPNISVGLPVLASVRAGTRLPIDVHLMIVDPESWIERFARAGANAITVHVEACTHLYRALQRIAEAGAEPSVSLNPGTPLDALDEVIPIVRQILVMTVNPGFGGQKFLSNQLRKIELIGETIVQRGLDIELEVDGGVDAETARDAIGAGATALVAGTAVFRGGASAYADNIKALRGSS